MCGLVAIINKYSNGYTKVQVDAMADLLYVSALRGMDSTGVFMVTNDDDLYLAKEATPSLWYRETKEYKELMSKAFKNGIATVGHTRWATKGVVTDENAHPFVVDDKITMVHNGTLYGDHKQLADTEVDSHAIAHVLSKEDDIAKALQQLSGAYALIWHNFEKKSIYFVRNSQRPLFYMETGDGYYWASESSTLAWIKAKYNMTPQVDITSLKESELHTFTFNNKSVTRTIEPIVLTKAVPITYYSGQNSGSSWNWRNHQNNRGHHSPYDPDYWDQTPTPVVTTPLPVIETPPTVPAQTIIEDGPRQSSWLETEERKIAASNDMNMNKPVFAHVTSNYNERTHVAAKCIDYLPVVKNNAASGWFVYAKIEEEPDVLVRVHVPPAWTEGDLLNWSINNKRVYIKIKGFRWNQYPLNFIHNNKWIIGGYGVIIGETIKALEVVVANA